LSKRNVKLILKVLSDLEPLTGSSNKKTLYSTRSCVNWAFFGTRGPTRAKKGPIYTQTRQINYYSKHKFFIYRFSSVIHNSNCTSDFSNTDLNLFFTLRYINSTLAIRFHPLLLRDSIVLYHWSKSPSCLASGGETVVPTEKRKLCIVHFRLFASSLRHPVIIQSSINAPILSEEEITEASRFPLITTRRKRL
jgi:hypothetical protein